MKKYKLQAVKNKSYLMYGDGKKLKYEKNRLNKEHSESREYYWHELFLDTFTRILKKLKVPKSTGSIKHKNLD